MYLDSQFLSALGSLANHGLNAECLQMVHADAKKCALRRWEQRLEAREQALLTERQGLEQAKRMHNTEVANMKKQLQQAKFASQMTPLLHDQPGAPAYGFLQHANVQIMTVASMHD